MPYNNLNLLYTEQQITTTTFTNQCTGVLSIEQLLQGKPYWEDMTKGTKKVKKTLILSEIPSDDLGFEWYEVAKNLLQDGFNIYVTANNQLIKISNINDIDEKLVGLIELLPKYQLLHLLNANHLKIDQVLIIEEWHWSLLKNSSELSDHKILNEKYLSGISEYFDDTQLECNLKFVSENVKFNEMIGRFLEYHIKTTKKLIISVKSIAWNLLLNNPKYTSIIQKIEKLYINDLQTENHITELFTIIEKINSLKCLSFSASKNLNNFFQLTDSSLYKNITNFKIKNCGGTTNLTKLLQNAKNLHRLNIIESDICLDPVDESFLSLQLFQFIDKTNEKLSESNTYSIRSILKNATNMAKVQIITENLILADTILDSEHKYCKIEKFHCPSVHGDISSILNNNLISLQLYDISYIKDNVAQFTQSISDLAVNLDEFNAIFINSSFNIKNLDLNNVKDLTHIKIPDLGWKNLQSISISIDDRMDYDHSKNIEHLNKILKAAPNCKQIILEYFNFTVITPSLIIPHDIFNIKFNNCTFEKIDWITEQNMIYNLTVSNCLFSLKHMQSISKCTMINVNNINIESCAREVGASNIDDLFLSKLCNLEKIRFSIDIKSEEVIALYSFLDLLIKSTVTNIKNLIEKEGVLNFYTLLYKNIKEIESLQSSNIKINVDSNNKPTIAVRDIFTHIGSTNSNNTSNSINKPSNYRINIYQSAAFEDLQGNAVIQFFNLKNVSLGDIPYYTIKGSVDYYEAHLQVFNIKNWQPLPSLSKDEYLHPDSIIISPPTGYELKYAPSLSQYFIKFEKEGRFDLKYQILVPQNEQHDIKAPDSQELTDLIKKYQSYGATGSFTPEDYSSGQAFINAICNKNFGPCGIRVLGFVYELSKNFGNIPYRIIVNDCHTYVEIRVSNVWLKFDLGGWEADLTIKEPPKEKYNNDDIYEEFFKQGINPNFVTWNLDSNAVEEKKTYNDYIKQLSIINGKRIFIQMDSSNNSILNLVYSLHENTINNRPLYYIHNADNLICSAPFITISENGQGNINKGPGGRLYDFLNKSNNLRPIIIINCNNFAQNEIASKLNELELNKIDGQSLPTDTLVLFVSDTESLTIKSILLSITHDSIDLSGEIIPQAISNILDCDYELQKSSSFDSITPHQIEMYNSSNWYQILVGEWLTEEKTLKFKKGKLLEAIENNIEELVLINAPWHLLEFAMFWQQALQNKFIIVYGKKIELSSNLVIYKRTREYNNVFSTVTIEDAILQELPILPLNSSTINQFFKTYTTKDTELLTLPGLIKKYKEGICIYQTEEVSQSDLMRIKEEADINNVKIHFIIEPTKYDYNKLGYYSANIYVSNNVEESVKKLKDTIEHSEAQIIDISGIKDSIINIMDAHLDIENKTIIMNQEKGFLLKSLQEGKKVILKGNFDEHLINILSPFLIPNNKKSEHYKYVNNLTLVADSNVYLDLVNYIQINEKVEIQEQKTYKNSMLIGMNLSAKELIKQRLKLIRDALLKEKYVFIAGPTGCGKTEFINNLPKYMKDFKEESELEYEIHTDIKKWIECQSCDKKHVLFLDEANLTGNIHSHSWIENLYNKDEPFVIYKGRKINVTKNHFVIMAGNLTDDIYYTGARVTPYIFKRPNIIVFNPLSKYFIAQILENYQLQRQDIHTLLDIYVYICTLSNDYIALTPRELRMIADLIIHANYSVTESANLIITYALNNHEHKSKFREWFEAQNYAKNRRELQTIADNDKFIMTESWRYPTRILIDFLKIRKQRSNGGLGGILFNGPCCGKTSLIKHVLEHLKYKEIIATDLHKYGNLLENINAYIIIPPNMPHTQIVEVLKLAFNKGIVVVIKNINNYPMLEAMLNNYLMGLNLDHSPNQAQGFTLICTTNPKIKTPISLALLHRLIKIELAQYNSMDLFDILNFLVKTKNLTATSKDRSKLLSQFETALAYASKKNYPEPDLRRLITALENQFPPNDSQQSDSKRINMRDDDNIYEQNVKNQNVTTSNLLTFSERKKVANENNSMATENLQENNPNIVKNLDIDVKNTMRSRFKRL